MKLTPEQFESMMTRIKTRQPETAIMITVHSEECARFALATGADMVHFPERREVWTLQPPTKA